MNPPGEVPPAGLVIRPHAVGVVTFPAGTRQLIVTVPPDVSDEDMGLLRGILISAHKEANRAISGVTLWEEIAHGV